MRSVTLTPPHSLVLVHGDSTPEVPPTLTGEPIAATSSCIAIGCYPEVDGPTIIVLGAANAVDPGRAPDFREQLALATSARIRITTTEGNVVLEDVAPSALPMVSVWLSDRRFPEQVIVGLEAN